MGYTIDHSTMPPSFLPADLDRSNLIDVTRLQDPFRRYMDVRTGEIHDGAVYAAAAVEMVMASNPGL